MGELHLVLPALDLYILDAGILIMVQHVSLMMFFLNMVDYPICYRILVLAQVPWVLGLGLRVWGLGFTIFYKVWFFFYLFYECILRVPVDSP